ncbi:hypothetical protein KC357_g8936 [Hortaea werneckii]|nr:hypothetical protein KC357_g8936 [Hortaea werneckii]
MPAPAPTIDQQLQEGKFSRTDFSPDQQRYLCAFAQSPQATWASQPESASPPLRPVRRPQDQADTQRKAKVSSRISRGGRIRKPVSERPRALPRKGSPAQIEAGVAAELPLPATQLLASKQGTVNQVELSRRSTVASHDTERTTQNNIRQLFQPGSRSAQAQTYNKPPPLFGIFVNQRVDGFYCQAAQRVAAGVDFSLHQGRKRDTTEEDLAVMNAHKLSESTVKTYRTRFQRLGRAYFDLSQKFGHAVPTLADNIRPFGKTQALPGYQTISVDSRLVIDATRANKMNELEDVMGGNWANLWRQGNLNPVRPSDSGIDHVLMANLGSEQSLHSTLEMLEKQNMITVECPGSTTEPSYTVKPAVRAQIRDCVGDRREYWQTEALLMTAWSYPRWYQEASNDPSVRGSGPLFACHLEYTLDQNGKANPASVQALNTVLSALLDASTGPAPWKDKANDKAMELVQNLNDSYWKAHVYRIKGTRSRVRGRPEQSKAYLDNAHKILMAQREIDWNPLLNAELGEVMASCAQNSIQIESLRGALVELDAWQPSSFGSRSVREQQVSSAIHHKRGTVLRYLNEIRDAVDNLRIAFDTAPTKAKRRDILYDLAAALNDAGRFEEAETLLNVEVEICGREGKEDSKACRLLKLMKAEAYIQKDLLDNAQAIYAPFHKSEPFVMLQSRIGEARIAHLESRWQDAFEHWTGAMTVLLEQYPRGESHGGKTSLAILESTIVAICESQDPTSADAESTRKRIHELRANSDGAECENWIPGLKPWRDRVGKSSNFQKAMSSVEVTGEGS